MAKIDEIDAGLFQIADMRIMNVAPACVGARLPMSLDYADAASKSDSTTELVQTCCKGVYVTMDGRIGKEDNALLLKLIRARDRGSNAHCKALRQILVSMFITAPLCWWKEMDQYRVAVTTDSTSTMHRLSAKPIDRSSVQSTVRGDDFKWVTDEVLECCERLRREYIKLRDAGDERAGDAWRALVEALPDGYMQTREWTGSLQHLRQIYTERRGHKLVEWRYLCRLLENLPVCELITEQRDRESK